MFFADGLDTTEKKVVAATAVRTNLATFFAPEKDDGTINERIDFGFNIKDADGFPSGEIPFSDVFNVVRDTAGIRKIGDGLSDFLLNLVRGDVTILNREFPKLGTVTLRDGDTGQLI